MHEMRILRGDECNRSFTEQVCHVVAARNFNFTIKNDVKATRIELHQGILHSKEIDGGLCDGW